MRGRPLTWLAALGLWCTIVPARVLAQTSDEIFEQVFKRRAASQRVPVLLIVGGKGAGTVVVELQNGTVAQLPQAAILEGLASSGIRAEIRERLARSVRGAVVAADALRAAGLDVTYDAGRLELRVGMAATLTETASHTFAAGVPAQAATAIRPSEISGYVNLYGHGGTASPGSLRVESALDVRGWLLESHGELGQGPIGAHRGDVVLSRDVPDRALRYLAGDFAVAPDGLQPGFPILGLGVTRNFALQPYRIIQPVGVFEFTLDRPSRVTVLVNRVALQTLSLPPGRHDVRDLPLAGGVNDIELLIRDDAGVERRLQFSAASPNALLAPGVVQFSLSLGFPLSRDAGMRDYVWSRPVASGRRRWGMSDHLTLGASVDGDLDRQVAGAGFAVTTKLGNLAVEVAGSHGVDSSFGHAESVRYDHLSVIAGSSADTFTIAARHYSPAFRSLEMLELDGRYSGELALVSSRRLVAQVSAHLDLRYRLGRELPDAYDASVTFTRGFGGLSIDALVGVRASGAPPRDERVSVTARWRLPGRSSVHAISHASATAGTSNELRFATAPSPPPGGLVASASLHEDRATAGSDATLAYASQRFVSSATGVVSLDRSSTTTTAAGSFDVGTAIAFAGGHVAWSRPITGSFAIIDRNESLSDQVIGVNPTGGHFTAQADGLGPAVVPSLEPYRVGSVRVEAPDLRLGTSLGPASYALLPAYKSGTLIQVGEPGTVFLRGTLRHPDGTPVELEVGELVMSQRASAIRRDRDTEGPSRPALVSGGASTTQARPALVIMTNRAGRFSVVGVTPGHYEIRMGSGAPIGIEIPRGLIGVYSAGTLVMQPRRDPDRT
jgi:outer membrane usher protein